MERIRPAASDFHAFKARSRQQHIKDGGIRKAVAGAGEKAVVGCLKRAGFIRAAGIMKRRTAPVINGAYKALRLLPSEGCHLTPHQQGHRLLPR